MSSLLFELDDALQRLKKLKSKNARLRKKVAAADRLYTAVVKYWGKSRPVAFTKKDHRENPNVNGFNPDLYKALLDYESALEGGSADEL